MIFNIIVGNPPYNKGIDIDFMYKAFKLVDSSGFITMIVPAKWETASDDSVMSFKYCSYAEFRELIGPYISKVVFYPCCKEVFDILQVDGITYILIDKEHTKNKDNSWKLCEIHNKSEIFNEFNSCELRSIEERPTLLNIGNKIVCEIQSKLGKDYKKFQFNAGALEDGKRYKVWANSQIPGGGLQTYTSRRKGYFVGASYIEDILKDKSIEHMPSEKCIYSQDSLEDCKIFLSYFNSKLLRFLVFINTSKMSNMLTDDVFRFVPYIKLDRLLQNDEIYDICGITYKNREIINGIVKDR